MHANLHRHVTGERFTSTHTSKTYTSTLKVNMSWQFKLTCYRSTLKASLHLHTTVYKRFEVLSLISNPFQSIDDGRVSVKMRSVYSCICTSVYFHFGRMQAYENTFFVANIQINRTCLSALQSQPRFLNLVWGNVG